MQIPRHLIHAMLVLCLALLAQQPSAACNWDVSFSPPLPTSIAGSQTVGAIVYSGTVTYTITSCQSQYTSTNARLRFAWGSAPTPIQGMTGLSASNNNSAVLLSNGMWGASGPPAVSIGIGSNYTDMTASTYKSGNPANFTFAIGLVIQATAATVTGTMPSPSTPGLALVSGSPQLNYNVCGTGWVTENNTPLRPAGQQNWICTGYSSSGATTPVVTANTCTVSTPSVAVGLPNVSKTSLAAAGSTAGITPFTLSFSGCSTSAGGFTGTQTWAFTPGPASNVISNTGTATNVYAQILDSSMTPITNGGTTSFSVPAAGGGVSKQFYARYYSSGTAGAGTLNSTATFSMTYN